MNNIKTGADVISDLMDINLELCKELEDEKEAVREAALRCEGL